MELDAIEWLCHDTASEKIWNTLPSSQLTNWICKGPSIHYLFISKEELFRHALFVKLSNLFALSSLKSVISEIDREEYKSARCQVHEFECTDEYTIFQNRAALKIASIDAMTDFMFTSLDMPPSKDKVKYFGDLCGGPGAFTEYVYWRLKSRAKGFGMTLNTSRKLDWNLWKCTADAPTQSFEMHYGKDRTGDITSVDNIRSYSAFVHKHTVLLSDAEGAGHESGLHFVMGDGGFDAPPGKEEWQEACSRRILLGQVSSALLTLRHGGHFMCKTFDTFLPLACSVIYLLRLAFNRVAIIKPPASRPCSSERFIVCNHLRDCNLSRQLGEYILQGLLAANQLEAGVEASMSASKESLDGVAMRQNEVYSLVPLSVMEMDVAFREFMANRNNMLAERQCRALDKVFRYCGKTCSASSVILGDAPVEDEVGRWDRAESRILSLLKSWKLPMEPRESSSRGTLHSRRMNNPELVFEYLTSFDDSEIRMDIRTLVPRELESDSLAIVSDLHDSAMTTWGLVPCFSHRKYRGWLLSLRRATYLWDASSGLAGAWIDVSSGIPIQTNFCDIDFAACRIGPFAHDSLLEVEIFDPNMQSSIDDVASTADNLPCHLVLMVVDAIAVGGRIVSHESVTVRRQEMQCFALTSAHSTHNFTIDVAAVIPLSAGSSATDLLRRVVIPDTESFTSVEHSASYDMKFQEFHVVPLAGRNCDVFRTVQNRFHLDFKSNFGLDADFETSASESLFMRRPAKKRKHA